MKADYARPIRPLYTVLLEVGQETVAVGQFWQRDNAVAFGQQQQADGQAVMRAVVGSMSVPHFRTTSPPASPTRAPDQRNILNTGLGTRRSP
jgi:hypothetical protein